MPNNYSERVICVCSESVLFDGVIAVSRCVDRWDPRTKTSIYYCRPCGYGKREALKWLFQEPEEEEDNGPSDNLEGRE